ncbi:hypothetical protein PHET_01150 [Paragonimus heterotremus]|uniref:Uncharacterized protein n=1 Tax=Paragonimus heterotremus TaxID=100268 RepID=A0A8J4WUG6_9TREM|nr:hypothetical protein PHET_01150 [Paragonimus heterotremus]
MITIPRQKEYLMLVEQCMNFACEMMDLCRGTQEVEAVISDFLEDGTNIRDPLGRLRLAIRFEEKKLARSMRCPAAKFATHVVSHFLFLILLAAATFRLEENYEGLLDDRSGTAVAEDEESVKKWLATNFRPSKVIITHVQLCIVLWVAGLLLADVKHIYFVGFRSYIANSHNILNFCILSMYIGSYTLRIIVDRWVREADLYFNASAELQRLLQTNNSQLVISTLESFKNSEPYDKSYFIEACESPILLLHNVSIPLGRYDMIYLKQIKHSDISVLAVVIYFEYIGYTHF